MEGEYLKGKWNRIIRYYFYLSNGLSLLNEFRNLFLGIFAIYFTFKLTSIPFLILFFIVSIIILTVMGYYVIHHVAKIKDWLSLRFGSHFGIRSFDYHKGQFETLVEIKNLLNNNKKHESKSKKNSVRNTRSTDKR